ncbi:hypothetical protein INT45_006844 [Circinella minor]|uniref:Uncharacterized protein n=1 Tax=Circinella minor TaxID=1195481 RepID=A0A8H7RSZ5_9FUNG|nr:hypothetical protein INT45_006844 [Circinella minor]
MSSQDKSTEGGVSIGTTNDFATYQSKVTNVNTELDTKFEDMTNRIDKLEQTINTILQQQQQQQQIESTKENEDTTTTSTTE